jgi:hypothetical protein
MKSRKSSKRRKRAKSTFETPRSLGMAMKFIPCGWNRSNIDWDIIPPQGLRFPATPLSELELWELPTGKRRFKPS